MTQEATTIIVPADLPADLQGQIEIIVQRHNNLDGKVVTIRRGMDQMLGDTPDKQAEMLGFYGKLQKLYHYAHSKRWDTALFMAVAYLLLNNLEKIGIDPHQFGERVIRLFDICLGIAEKTGGL